MKAGWVISVNDIEARDQAYKCYSNKSREDVVQKASDLLERYENLFGEGRFKVEIIEPHTEVDPSLRIMVKTSFDVNKAFALLHDFDPLLVKEDDSLQFEINTIENLPEGFTKCSSSC